MRWTMSERRILVRGIAGRYQRSQKKGKGQILDEFVEMTGYQRNYASRLLRNQGRKVWVNRKVALVGDAKVRSIKKGRKRYGVEVQEALIRIWKMLDYLCGKRLVAAIPGALEALERHQELNVSEEVREKLLFAISVSHEPEAIPELLRAARTDEDPAVRGVALFWLAQHAGDHALRALEEAVADDPELEVKKQAVFGLSQLRGERAVPKLIEIAGSHGHPEVRRAAMFWLGQSGDPRALAFFERVLLD